jgi:hypothetical protein
MQSNRPCTGVVVADVVTVLVPVDDGELVPLVVGLDDLVVVGDVVCEVVGLDMWHVSNVRPSLCASIAKLSVSATSEQSRLATSSPSSLHANSAVNEPRL